MDDLNISLRATENEPSKKAKVSGALFHVGEGALLAVYGSIFYIGNMLYSVGEGIVKSVAGFTKLIGKGMADKTGGVSNTVAKTSRVIGASLVGALAVTSCVLERKWEAAVEEELLQQNTSLTVGPEETSIIKDSFENAAKACEPADVIFTGGFSKTLPKCKPAPRP